MRFTVFFVAAAAVFALALALSTVRPDPAQAQASAVNMRGKVLYVRCAACHAITPKAAAKTGPNLYAIVGKKGGAVPGYRYSKAMKAKAPVWNEANLDRWLAAPSKLVPGTSMAFAGMPNAADRKALIAYLKSRADGMSAPLLLGFDGAVATLTFNRPDKRNALSRAVWQMLPTLIGEACARRETRVIILTGASGNFAAGADIEEFDTVFASRAATLAYLDRMIAATTAIAAAPVPVIAQIEGLCIGAGVAIALACDVRIADSAASFAVTPAKLGLLYSLTDTRRLMAAVGASRAADLLFTGARIDAHRAEAIGLVDEIGDAAQVAAKARAIAANSSWSHAHTKQVLALVRSDAGDDADETRDWFADAVETADFAEGLAAFRARRPAVFPGR